MSGLARLIATWFGCGYAPKAPGTAGSLAALVIAWALHAYAGVTAMGMGWLAILLSIPGIWASDVVARESGGKDPQIVVVDEVVGQWMTLAGATALNWKSWLLAFILFRLFDIWKPSPVRQLERLPGGLGIIADDAMAGVYGALVLFAAGWFNLY
ncbi:MAG TPA: phosphatidylglycerophosphatase A [Bryobacteraceae bacterium]|nr:phosphatidylglycerophosphatase A [Bryobacteraceae bacterium]